MATVELHPIAGDGARVVDVVTIPEHQRGYVASIEKSLREVAADPALTAYAVRDSSAEQGRPVGFAVLEVRDGIGFILRMVVDGEHQGRGYGRALVVELVRTLRLHPDVDVVATSHRADNDVMAALCASVGFEPWDTPFDPPEGEVYLALPRSGEASAPAANASAP